MNFLARVSARNAELEAALADWLRQQGSGLVWPKADRVAFLAALLVLLAMLTAYGVPDTEATIWLRTQIAFWMNAILFASAGVTVLALITWNGGKGLTIRLEDAPALPGGEQHLALSENLKLSPRLTDGDRLQMAAATNPTLNASTGAQVKACLAAGMTVPEIALALNLSEGLIYRYSSAFNRALAAVASGTSPIDLEI